jgi:hypothetical protein
VKEFFSRARAKGKAEGEARGLARALLEVRERRRIEVDETLSKEVLACRDEARMLGWIEKAATANDLADDFD